MAAPNASMSSRARVRAELTAEIKRSAREQLAERGAADLSLRAVARDLGMVSSAMYRYFASRDELLTALIVDAYNALGAVAEDADAGAADQAPAERFRIVGRAARAWAVEHPHEYALVFGSPVPGYAAPTDTVGPAARLPLVLIGVISDAHRAGSLQVRGDAEQAVEPRLAADVERLRAEAAPDLPPAVVLRALASWPALFGAINFELFGHFHNVIDDKATLFDYELDRIIDLLGL